jgi:uncharacterized membrane protein
VGSGSGRRAAALGAALLAGCAAALGAALLAGCAATQAAPPVASGPPGLARAEAALAEALRDDEAERASGVRAWTCDGGLPVATQRRRGGGELLLVLPEGAALLRRAESAAGERWAAEGVVFQERAGEARLETGDGVARRCREDRPRAPAEAAKLRGVEFRATGEEPGWVLEIGPRRTVFVTDQGETRVELPTPEPSADPGAAATRYRAVGGGHELVVTVHERRCPDATGAALSGSRVEVALDGRLHHGCGQSLH